jgi:mannose-1-phosphate guanylyltransferase
MNWLVIMAGGSGERFWPMSRRTRPKQLLALTDQATMIQQTVSRLAPLFDNDRIMVVTSQAPAPLLRRQLPQLKKQNIVVEPVGRNTAPCIALAAALIQKRDPQAVIAVVPADSWVGNVKRYQQVVRDSLKLAGCEDVLITIGIKPTFPHTGYGYIQLGPPHGKGFWNVRQFVEKPSLSKAKRFFASGKYRWNAGMFVWSANAVTDAFRKFRPDLLSACQRIAAARSINRALTVEYPKLEKISVDYAIMEKADNVVVANGDFPWDDVGDWPALARHTPTDASGNAVRGPFAGLDTRNCIVISDDNDQHVIGTIGVEDIVIVHTGDATLVCRKQDAQRVRDLVKLIGANQKLGKVL